jgi:hypothetical protein
MPNSVKIYAKKKGSVCTVYEDPTSGQIIPVTNYEDTPAGFPVTFTSVRECQARYPGQEIVFVEPKPTGKQKVLPPLDKENLSPQDKQVLENGLTPTPQPKAKLEESVEIADSSLKARCEDFVEKLAMAHKYASAKNKRVLAIKLEAVMELIDDVFK